MVRDYVINESITGEDLKRVRQLLKMTQKEFAEFANCSKRTVENWESKGEPVKGPIVTLVEILLRHPGMAEQMKVEEKRLKLRLWYMYEDTVCTVIDVDEPRRIVRIRNYIDDPLFRAFGKNTEPSFEDYEEFLKSRCFPESRDKIKLELDRLGIPFYDPIMIIEKTEGRMADDKFRIRIER
ncbi:MAG: helix-turn-helix domain-containing protein [Clostridiales bacterium]|nr:helix-turn-helix domain-containing protein [Clostridiales bacterium]